MALHSPHAAASLLIEKSSSRNACSSSSIPSYSSSCLDLWPVSPHLQCARCFARPEKMLAFAFLVSYFSLLTWMHTTVQGTIIKVISLTFIAPEYAVEQRLSFTV